MWKDKNPKKWALLAFLFLIVLLAILAFFGMNAKAGNGKFMDIQSVKTPSGLTVWLVEDHRLPIIAVEFAFRDTGAALDPADKQGLVRMLSNTMDEGAGDLTSQEFQKALADNSINLTFNASRDVFGGSLKTLSDRKDKAFDLLAMAVNVPRFDSEAVDRMREGNVARIKSSMSEPDWMAARLMNDKAFEGHPYSQNTGGTLSSLARISPTDLREFKNKYLVRDHLLIAVAGDMTAEQIGPYIDQVFSKLPTSRLQSDIADVKITNAGKAFLYEQDIPQTIIEISMPSFDYTDKDYYALQITNYIYGGAGFGSRLMETAREQRGLTYGIYSSAQQMMHTDLMTVSTSTKTESTNEMLSIIDNEMIKLQQEPVSAKELSDAKAYITGSMPLALSSTDKIAGMVLNLQINDLPIDYLDQYGDNIEKVSAQDIMRVAKRVLVPANAVTVLVGKPQNVEKLEIVKELPNVL